MVEDAHGKKKEEKERRQTERKKETERIGMGSCFTNEATHAHTHPHPHTHTHTHTHTHRVQQPLLLGHVRREAKSVAKDGLLCTVQINLVVNHRLLCKSNRPMHSSVSLCVVLMRSSFTHAQKHPPTPIQTHTCTRPFLHLLG